MPVSDYGALLVLDSQKCSLGQAALTLVRLGVEALYANDIDEASLLARQEGARVRGALAPASAGPAEAAEILEALAPHTNIRPASLVLCRAAAGRGRDRGAARRGLRWSLWEPYEPSELRFLATLAVWEGSDSDLRIEPRVPTSLRASVTLSGKTRPVRVLDLTTSGRLPRDGRAARSGPPPRPRDRAAERLDPDRRLRALGARRRGEAGPPERPAGAGVEFAPPRPAEAEALRAQMLAGMSRFELDSKPRASRGAQRAEGASGEAARSEPKASEESEDRPGARSHGARWRTAQTFFFLGRYRSVTVPVAISAARPTRLRERRVRVHRQREVLDVGAELERERRLGDQLAGAARRPCRRRAGARVSGA